MGAGYDVEGKIPTNQSNFPCSEGTHALKKHVPASLKVVVLRFHDMPDASHPIDLHQPQFRPGIFLVDVNLWNCRTWNAPEYRVIVVKHPPIWCQQMHTNAMYTWGWIDLNRLTPSHGMVAWWIMNVFCFSNWGYVTHISPQHLPPLEVTRKHRGVPQGAMCQLLPLCCNATATQVLAVRDGVVFQGVRTWEPHEPIHIMTMKLHIIQQYPTYIVVHGEILKNGGKGGDIQSLTVEFTLPVHIEALDSHRHKK